MLIYGYNKSMKIKWDDSNMRSGYANVCNVTSTREEVVLLFGMFGWRIALLALATALFLLPLATTTFMCEPPLWTRAPWISRPGSCT